MRISKEIVNKIDRPERVIQFGEGNFLRAFADWMIDKLNSETNFNGNVVVVQPIKKGLINNLNEQDGLYTLYIRGIKNGDAISETTVINSISRGINPYDNYEEFIKTAESKDMRYVISNTTESGIYYEEDDYIEDKPQKSFGGKLTAWLYHRYKFFGGDKQKGMIILPCELIEKNGYKLKEVILKHIDKWNLDEGFITWIEESNLFCNTLVDRIVPGYPKDKIEEITKELGYKDDLVVEAEQFHLWVIEAPKWVGNELPLDKIGLNVKFVEDITPYRIRKVRILNGAHTSMVPVSYLYGLRTVKESVEDGIIGEFINQTLYKEIVPTLTLSRNELQGFTKDVMDRFRNPFIKHYLISISLNSMTKYKTRVLPSLIKYYEDSQSLPKRLVFSLASLIRFYKGEYNGESILLNDDEKILEFFRELWGKDYYSKEDYKILANNVLGYEELWKQNLKYIKGLSDLLAHYLYIIDKDGIKKGLTEVIQ